MPALPDRITLALFSLCLAPALGAQALDDQLLGKVQEVIRAEMGQQGIVGLSAAIGVDGKVAWTKGFGLADMENDVPATEHTVYRLASISKPVTATAVMQLVEQGKIDLDAPVGKYVSIWPKKRWPVTVRQVLCHQGGIRHYAAKDVRNNTKAYATATASLEYFADDPLIHRPGSKYSYSSYGYNLLGAVVEGASGMSFVNYLEKNVFSKAGTEAMQDDSHARVIKHRAQGYRRTGGGASGEAGAYRNSMLVDVSYKVGGGGLCSTAADLVRFAQAVHAGQLIEARTRDMMWKPQKTRSGDPTTYGFGWQISTRDGRRTIGHSGSQARVRTHLLLLPAERVVVSVMSNTEGSNPGRIVTQIAALVADARRH